MNHGAAGRGPARPEVIRRDRYGVGVTSSDVTRLAWVGAAREDVSRPAVGWSGKWNVSRPVAGRRRQQ